MIKNVMLGKDEGADNSSSDEENATDGSRGIAGRVSSITFKNGYFLYRTKHKKQTI